MLGVLYVGPFEGVAAAAVVGLVGVEAEMGRQVLTDYLLCGRQRRDPWLIMLLALAILSFCIPIMILVG